MVSVEELEKIISQRLEAYYVSVNDVSGGCGSAFEAVIVSGKFEGLPKLQRHRLVFKELKPELANVHAFSQKNYSIYEWKLHEFDS